MTEEYSRQQLEEYAMDLQNKLSSYEANTKASSRPSLNSSQNAIVEWQLNLDKELELIHHQIRGHIIVRDNKNGNETWEKPANPEDALLNEKGAGEIEKIIRNYLNKNLLLSDFSQEQINDRMKEFAHRLRRFIYLNYEEFGLTTYYKQKHFEMIVMNIVDMVESAYNRAKDGGERQSLTTIRQIIQSENIDNRGGVQSYSGSGEKKTGFFGRMFGK